jgi:hypothetical protein
MFGRTFRIALLLIASQCATGCWCCCDRPFFWRKNYGGYGGCGGCCEPCCTTCCGSPVMPSAPPIPHAGPPVYMAPPVAAPAAPTAAPQLDRMQPISSTALNGR